MNLLTFLNEQVRIVLGLLAPPWSEQSLPDSESPDLHLCQPTPQELTHVLKLNFDSWRDALSLPLFLDEAAYLSGCGIAKDGGMTEWVLVDRNFARNKRPILSSCETFRKRALLSDADGNVSEVIIHGIASVYCDPKYRHRGYASRMMRELADSLPGWQTESKRCVASVLFSDIGKKFYADVGWRPFPSHHVEFDPLPKPTVDLPGPNSSSTPLHKTALPQLCNEDEALVRKSLSRPSEKPVRVTIVPSHEQLEWHHGKEEFVCERVFDKEPQVKGAISGEVGNRVWVIWTHRFYEPFGDTSENNTLYILRLVIENQDALDNMAFCELPYDEGLSDLLVGNLKAVLQAAQAEAAAWKLRHVKLWDPSPLVQQLIEKTGMEHRKIQREKDEICCLNWHGGGGISEDSIDWIGMEMYGWC